MVPENVLRDLELLMQRETKELLDEADDVVAVILTLHNHLGDLGVRTPRLLLDILDKTRSLRGMAVQILEGAEAVPVAIRGPGE